MLLKLIVLIGFLCLANSFSDKNRIQLSEKRIPIWKNFEGLGVFNQGPYYGQPEQVHLSYGGDVSLMFVTWLTFDDTDGSQVDYGTEYDRLDNTAYANVDYFKDGGSLKSVRYTHRANITNIQPGVRYFYRVGSQYGWSAVYSFVGLKERSEGGYRFAVYGDMGNVNARSLGKIQRLAQRGDFDMVLHNGDMAYNLDTDNGEYGDEFMRQIEPVSAYVPYMTVVGNHEYNYNFSHYVNRYTMPNTRDNLFYSFDIGKAHIIAFSTEFYFFLEYGFQQIVTQWNFLIHDLEKANKNRENVPWIIVMGHRPMYCSTFDTDDCSKYDSVIRTGLPKIHSYGLEKLFYKYGVDLEIWAHEHTFERLYPVYNRTVYNGTQTNPYLNPPAPVHIITGSAGCQEKTDQFVKNPGPWSAFRSSHYGFSRMHVFNATHLHFEQILAANDTIEDSVWIVKHSHGPYKLSDLHRLKRFGVRVPEDYCHHPADCVRDDASNNVDL